MRVTLEVIGTFCSAKIFSRHKEERKSLKWSQSKIIGTKTNNLKGILILDVNYLKKNLGSQERKEKA